MIPKTDLDDLLRTMRPVLADGEFVFCSVPVKARPHLDVSPVCEFREAEGITLILARPDAEGLNLPHAFVCRMITLTVYSGLEAVGFLAAVIGRLAERGISVNSVAGFYHDHLFVPADRAEEAMRILVKLQQNGLKDSKLRKTQSGP
jgi:uncharacterized protein